MTQQDLSISVTFLANRYHGKEWPPSPARLYQAVVAGLMTGNNRNLIPAVESALRWLEQQAPPQISICANRPTQRYRIAVPNNDMDSVARQWAAGKDAEPSKLKTMKPVAATELAPDGPHVRYTWNVSEDDAVAVREPLRAAVHCLHTLGWGVDMAFASVDATVSSGDTYLPSVAGERYAVPMVGTLDDLRETYERFAGRAQGKGVDTHTRPSVFRMQPYAPQQEQVQPYIGLSLMKKDGSQRTCIPWEDCMKVAGWLRHASAHHLRHDSDFVSGRPAGFVEEFVEGHTSLQGQGERISYVPVPSIAGPYGDGRIRRALLLEPKGFPGDVIQQLDLKLDGKQITDREGRIACTLLPATLPLDATFRRYLPSRLQTRWRSVTPVVLHGFNVSHRGAISVPKTERLLLRAFEMAGYPADLIQDLCFQTAPFWTGTKHAAAILLPDHLQRFPRLHVEVRFRKPVSGPVLAGLGRHYGIGLFAGLDEERNQ